MTTTISGSYPAVNSDTDATIHGITVGLGAGSVATNTAVGTSVLQANTTGSNNTAVGYQAGYTQTGSNCNANVYIGYKAGYTTNGVASLNLFAGTYAGYSNTTGTGNTYVGGGYNYGAGYYMTTGSKNTILGSYNGNQGGLDIRTSDNNIVLSDGDGNPRQVINSSAYFGFNTSDYSNSNGSVGYVYAYSGGSANIVTTYTSSVVNKGSIFEYRRTGRTNVRCAQFSLQENSSAQGEVQVYSSAANADVSGGVVLSNGATSWSAVSDETKKDIIEPIENGLAKIATLRAVIGKYKNEPEGIRRSFLIAQDVQAVLPEAVSPITDITDNTTALGLAYSDVIPLLVAAIKELNAKFDAYVASHP
jgi:hypothetical protein